MPAKALTLRQVLGSPQRDPRRGIELSPRDLAALRFIGEGYEVAQYQLHEAFFRMRSPNVTSRFVLRAQRKGLILAERLHGIGMNRLRLTKRGREVLTDIDPQSAERCFAPRKWVALKDLAHTLWINDLRVVLGERLPPPDELLPAWALQRELGPGEVIPDLLAVWHGRDDRTGLRLACEIDLGGESLSRVFLPKLGKLRESLAAGQPLGEPNVILVLTTGGKRVLHIREWAESFEREPSVIVENLPSVSGLTALDVLRSGLDS